MESWWLFLELPQKVTFASCRYWTKICASTGKTLHKSRWWKWLLCMELFWRTRTALGFRSCWRHRDTICLSFIQPNSVSNSCHQLLRGRQLKYLGLTVSFEPHSCRLFQRLPVEASDLKIISNLLESICYSKHFADHKGTETIITQTQLSNRLFGKRAWH